MSDTDVLARLRALCEEAEALDNCALPAPWEWDNEDEDPRDHFLASWDRGAGIYVMEHEKSRAFICRARTLLPTLVRCLRCYIDEDPEIDLIVDKESLARALGGAPAPAEGEGERNG